MADPARRRRWRAFGRGRASTPDSSHPGSSTPAGSTGPSAASAPSAGAARTAGAAPTDGLVGRTARRTAAVAIPAVLLTLALTHPGLTEERVELDDGGVWVTRADDLALGRYNPTIDDLTGGLLGSHPDLDVRQQGSDVLLVEPGHLGVVDPATVTVGARVDVPAQAQVALAGDSVLVADPLSGNAWLRPLGALATLRVDAEEPDLALGLGGVVALGLDGVAHALIPDGTELRAELHDEEVVVTRVRTREPAPAGVWTAATVVGEDLVVSDGAVLSLPQQVVDAPVRAVLQEPGPAAAVVVAATAEAVHQIDLSSAERVSTPTGSSGTPAVPVVVGACLHAAWSQPDLNYATDCGDGVELTQLHQVSVGDYLVFRSNRGRVVLNDVGGGYLWLPQEGPQRRGPSWDAVIDVEQLPAETDPGELTAQEPAECIEEIADPLATPDAFGVRAGATVILPVLDNDSSRACGVLAIASLGTLPEDFATLTPIHGGRAVQVQVSPEATGTQSFTYTVSDGRATTTPAQAEVVLTVAEGDAAPVQVRTATVQVEQGGSVLHDLLGDLLDPEGEEMRILSVSQPAGAGISVAADGRLAIRPDGQVLGRLPVSAQVTDGTHTVAADLTVEVHPADSLPPQVGPVQASTAVDLPVTLRPLTALLSTGAAPVRLASVAEVPGLQIETNTAGGTFTVTAATPGSYVVPYVLVSASQATRALARIDVADSQDAQVPLTAVRDVAYLPARGEVSIEPLANDVMTPGTGALLLGVSEPPDSPVRAAVSDRSVVTLRQVREVTEPVELTVRVTDGAAVVTSPLVVVPLPATDSSRPPLVPELRATVRTDGVVTIPVLEHATDPDGDALTLAPTLPQQPSAGQMWVSGDVLRYQAPATPGQYTATATVRDEGGNEVGARVQIQVHAADAETKAPPRPREISARVFAGESVRIEIPLRGIDDDGDLVMLQGPATAPALGLVAAQGSTWLEYAALPGAAGTDTFEYAVEDWAGQRARGTIRVTVAPRPESTNTVTALDDLVQVRPGQRVIAPVLDNDRDAGGAGLQVAPALEIDVPGVAAAVVPDGIEVTAPQEEGVVNIVYTALTASGGWDQAVLTVQVSAEAELAAPIAADVVVRPVDTIDATSSEVAVLTVARNPAGSLADLTVSVPAQYADVARVTPAGTVVVALGPQMRTIPYLLTSAQLPDLPAVGFITVPALGDFPPVIRPRAPMLTVVSGELLQIDLSDQVKVAPGKRAVVGAQSTASVTRGDGTPVVVDAGTLQYRSELGYAGPAAVTIEVADGDLADATTRTSLLTFPITVLPTAAYPPVFTGTTLEVPAGDSAVSVDLLDLTTSVVDEAGGRARYSYTLTGPAPVNLDVTLQGSVLTVAAASDVPAGTRGTLPIAVEYGGAERVEGRVEVVVTGTRRPLARVLDHRVEASAGEPVAVDLLQGSFNPFPALPLTVLDAAITAGSGTVALDGSTLLLTPTPGLAQQLTVSYRVGDATGERGREVTGSVTATVLGRPDAPPAPSGTAADGVVDLTWSPPAANGSPITGYRVTESPGGRVTECPATVCTIAGLSNGTAYTFTVTALNAVGESDPGPVSAPLTPDVLPQPPGAPVVERGDGTLAVSWPAAETSGTAVRTYRVEIIPGGVREVAGSQVSLLLEGLVNGTEYTVRVQAVNALGAGEWSTTAVGTPAGLPGVPSGLAAPGGLRADGNAQVTVSWQEAAANGEAITGYVVALTGPGGRQETEVSGTSWTSGALTWGASYTVAVRARNAIGDSPWSEPVALEVWAAPEAPVITAATGSTGRAQGSGTVTVSWDPPARSGVAGAGVTCYEVTLSGVTTGTFEHCDTTLERTGLNGGEVTISVRARNARQVLGPAATATAAVVNRPSVELRSQVVSDRLVLSWVSQLNGATAVREIDLRLDTQPVVVPADAAGFTSDPLAPGEYEVSLRVRTDGGWSAVQEAEVTVAPPAPTPEPTPQPTPAPTPEPSGRPTLGPPTPAPSPTAAAAGASSVRTPAAPAPVTPRWEQTLARLLEVSPR